MIAARQIAFGGSKRKPYDAEIEYLESTGTQYILHIGEEEEVIDGIDCVIKPLVTNAGTYGCVGFWNGGSQVNTIRYQTLHSRYFTVTNGQNNANVYSGLTLAMRHVTVKGTAVTIDGQDFEMGVAWGVVPKSTRFALFGCYNTANQSVDTQAGIIGKCTLYIGNRVVRDFIPVRVGDVGYMYDRVSGKLFGNAGTGAFVLGADV